MKNVSVRWKMIILALITLIGTLAIGVLAVNRMLVMEEGSESVLRTSIEDDYDENIKNQVDNAISMLDAVYAGYENGDYSYEGGRNARSGSFKGNSGMETVVISGRIPMTETMLFCSEARPREQTVWRQRMRKVTRW